MKHLTEDNIKRAGIRFLKGHYKYRPRTGKTIAAFDQETEDGIITDGMLTFIREDGSPFIASLEATSFDSKEEVLYSIQEKLLKWDSIVAAVFLAVLFFTLSHYYDWVTVNKDGWMTILFFLFAILAGGFWIFNYLIKNFPRYRYIYAVEQFKKYHADEQWIAIADDVFETTTDPYLKELKTQCVKNGFGLISVDLEEEAHILITPSRQEIFGQSRANKNFNSRDEYAQSSKTEKVKSIWNKMLSKLSGSRTDSSVFRYQRTFTSQILLSLIAFSILGGIFYKEAQNAPIVFVDEKQYEKDLSQLAKKSEAESTEYMLDSALVDPHDPKVKPYLEELASEKFTEDDEERWDMEIAKYFDDSGEEYAEIYISSGGGKFVSYDCERFFSYTGTKYLIQEKAFDNVRDARKQLIRLKKRGINAHCLWAGCLNDSDMEFIIFVDFLFDEKREAGLISKNMQRRFQLKKGNLKIRSITL